jgi:hypothetical protein
MRPHIPAVLIAACSLLFALPSRSTGRPVREWSYAHLFKEADLVLLLEPQSTRDAVEKDGAVPPRDYLTGVVTTLKVLHVIKGEFKQQTIDLVHFRYKKGAQVENGPGLVSFKTGQQALSGKRWSGGYKPDYVVFLKKDKNGRFEFVSGNFDSDDSVKEVHWPLPSDE